MGRQGSSEDVPKDAPSLHRYAEVAFTSVFMVAIAHQSHILSCQAWRKGRSPQSGLQKVLCGLPPTPLAASFCFLTSSLPWSLCSSLGAGRGLCTDPSASLLFHQQFPSVIFLTLVKISAQKNTSQGPNLTIRIINVRWFSTIE